MKIDRYIWFRIIIIRGEGGGGLTTFFLSKGKEAFKGAVAYLRGGGAK